MAFGRSEIDYEKLSKIAGAQAPRLLSELYDFLAYRSRYDRAQFFFESLEVSPESKISLIKETLRGKSPLFYEFIALLAKEGMLFQIDKIVREFQSFLNRNGIEFVRMFSAFPVPEQTLEKLAAKLEALTGGKKVFLHLETDPTLLGGMVLVFSQGRVLDGSLRGRLGRLKKEMAQ